MKNATWYKVAYEVNSAVINTGKPIGNDSVNVISTLLTIRRLAKKHHRLAEMACNGEGWISGKFYTWDNQSSKMFISYSPAVGEDRTIFDVESNKVEAKIKALVEKLGLRVEFQGDPRGYTVKVFHGERFLDIN